MIFEWLKTLQMRLKPFWSALNWYLRCFSKVEKVAKIDQKVKVSPPSVKNRPYLGIFVETLQYPWIPSYSFFIHLWKVKSVAKNEHKIKRWGVFIGGSVEGPRGSYLRKVTKGKQFSQFKVNTDKIARVLTFNFWPAGNLRFVLNFKEW